MNNTFLQGKVAIITGAAQGMGRVMALALVQRGASVVVVDINISAAKAATEEMVRLAGTEKVLLIKGDVSNLQDCERVFEQSIQHFGTVHALVNNAGRGMTAIREDCLENPVRFWEVAVDRWQALIDLNVRGPFLMAKTLAPHFIRQKWGRIVNVTTSLDTMYRTATTPYGQSKAALEAATASWARDLEGTGVTCNALLPGGPVNTAFFAKNAPIQREKLIQPDVMAAPICWLLSDESDGVTGRRFIAQDWDPTLPARNAAETAGAPAAWPSLAPVNARGHWMR